MAAVDEVKSRLDILDVVSQYAPLHRAGKSYKAVCPFHTEKTPSFFVFPERQSWRCFGACATGGDIFTFVMRIENLDFTEALKRLAGQAGVKLADKRGRGAENDVLYQLNEAAREFFCNLLASETAGASARAYLRGRGITQETSGKFQLGLSPGDGESLKRFLTSKGYTEGQLALAGLVTRGENGGYRDLFRRRLMFPIRDAEGRLTGFGARALDDSLPKYLNSPRSPVFDKGHVLYALHLAKDDVQKAGFVIVEGYMDAIAAHQHGFSNVTASMGTALTRQQVSLVLDALRRPGSSSKDVILALDPDVAGQEATLRSLESSWNVFQARLAGRAPGVTLYERQESPSLKIAPLPEGKDPAEIILENAEEWSRLINNAVPLMDYLFVALSSRLDLSTSQGKAKIAELLFPLIAATPEPFQQDYHFQRLASLLGVSGETLRASLGRGGRGGTSYRDRSSAPYGARSRETVRSARRSQEAATTPFTALDHDPIEEYCLALVLQDPNLTRLHEPLETTDGGPEGPAEGTHAGYGNAANRLRMEYFRRVENREVFTNWIKCSTLDALAEVLDDDLKGHLESLLAKALPPSDRKQRESDFTYCARRLEERFLRELNLEEGIRLSEASQDEREEQEHKIVQVSDRLKRILTG